MDDQSPTEKLLDHIQEIAAKKSAEVGEPMWHVYGEWGPAPITPREIQSYTEYEFNKLPKKRKVKIYRFLLRRKIKKLWDRFCILAFMVIPALSLIYGLKEWVEIIPFIFFTLIYIIYLAHKIGCLEGYDKGYIDLKERDDYIPEGISIKFRKKNNEELKNELRAKVSANPKLMRLKELSKKYHLALLRLGMSKEE